MVTAIIMLVVPASAVDRVGKFDDYLIASQASSRTEISHEWIGIMSGTSETTFSPNQQITNAMTWVMIAKMGQQNFEGGQRWYSKAQDWIKNCGIGKGINPNDPISREQLLTMMYNFAMKFVDFNWLNSKTKLRLRCERRRYHWGCNWGCNGTVF